MQAEPPSRSTDHWFSRAANVFRHRLSLKGTGLSVSICQYSRLASLRQVADEVKAFGRSRLDFAAAFEWLREEWGVQRLLGEGGGELNSALFHAGMVDELHLTVCPFMFGGAHAPTIADGTGVKHLVEAARLELQSQHRIGDEMFLVYRVVSGIKAPCG